MPYSAKEFAISEDKYAEPSTFVDGLPLPRLIIFDLDYTLWPFWVDTHVSPPLKAHNDNLSATDRTGESFAFYKDVPQVLRSARAASIPLALASRTHTPDLATQLLKLLHIPSQPGLSDASDTPKRANDFFASRQIFPGDKKTHMTKLNKSTKIEFEDMLFFDDESRNKNVETLGVCFWLVRDGVTVAEVDNGVREWRKRKGATQDDI